MSGWDNIRSILSMALFDLAASVAPKQERLSACTAVFEHFKRMLDEEKKRRESP